MRRTSPLVAGVALLVLATSPRPSFAQGRPPLLQLEVADSVGIPLPDAKLETYTLMSGAVFREWVVVTPNMLTAGTHLVRVSSAGFAPVALSVPLKNDSQFSLRVRLHGLRSSISPKGRIEPGSIAAIGIPLGDPSRPDVVQARRIVLRETIEQSQAKTLPDLLRRLGGADVVVTTRAGGSVELRGAWDGGASGCLLSMLANGDPRFPSSLQEIDDISDVEAIEIFRGRTADPYMRKREPWQCGLVIAWLKSR